MNFNKLTKLALAYIDASENNFHFKHCSIIIHKKSIVAIGRNSNIKTHPFLYYNNYRSIYVHSEVAAFTSMDRSYLVNKCNLTLINFRFDRKNNNLVISMPCKYCQSWIFNFFDEIWYSTNQGTFERF